MAVQKKRGRPAVLTTERVEQPKRYVIDPEALAAGISKTSQSPDQSRRQKTLEKNQKTAERIELSLSEKRPFDPEMVSPGCDYAMIDPLPLGGPENHILHIHTRGEADLYAAFDIESSSLLATNLHHAVLMRIKPGEFITVGLNDKPVVFCREWVDDTTRAFVTGHPLVTRTWSAAKDSLVGVMRTLIDYTTAKGTSSGRAKILAHYGAGFDWSGLAMLLGIDRHYGMKEEFIHKGKKRTLDWSVEVMGDKPRIVMKCGSGASLRIELVDSSWTLSGSLDVLSGETKKGVLPLMFSNPDRWLKAEGYDVPPDDLNVYRKQAHLAEIDEEGKWVTHYRLTETGELTRTVLANISEDQPFPTKHGLVSKEAHAAITHWKQTLTQRELDYSKSDVIVLANAYNRFADVSKRIGIAGPYPFNTSAMIGHSALVQGVYQRFTGRDEQGNERAKNAPERARYAFFKDNIMALLPHDKSLYVEQHGHLPKKTDEELREAELSDPEDEESRGDDEPDKPSVVFQHTGIVTRTRGQAVIVKNPVYCTKRVNQEFRRVQRGGRCEVLAARNLPGTSMVSIDAKSMYPSVMARGVSMRITIDGQQRESAVLRDFVDPRFLKSGWSWQECGKEAFAGIEFDAIQQPGVLYDTFVVRGRISALKFLQHRGGMFYVKLPRSACDAFRNIPVIPVNTFGADTDARLVFPDWKGMLHTYITGEELAYYLSEPTVDDDSVEIDLNRSVHAALITTPFGGVVGDLFVARSAAQAEAEQLDKQARDAHSRRLAGENISKDAVDQLENRVRAKKAEEDILKRIMSSAYGTLAQQNAPEIDIDLENLHQISGVLLRLKMEDPLWASAGLHAKHLDGLVRELCEIHEPAPVAGIVGWQELIESTNLIAKLLTPGWKVIRGAEAAVSRKGTQHVSIEDVIETIKLRVDKKNLLDAAEGDESDAIRKALNLYQRRFKALSACFKGLFQDYAESHLARYSTNTTRSPSGRNVEHVLLSLLESTAAYAIRPWATAITAKARVALLLAMRAVQQAGAAQVLYYDTDSVHFSIYCDESQDPALLAAEMLKNQSFIKIGNQLGQWQIERKRVRRGLAVAGKGENADFLCRHVYYASKKVYVMADAERNVLDCRARGITRSDARRQAAFLDYSMRISKLGDRRGIRVDNEARIDLMAAKKISSTVIGMDGKPRAVHKRIRGLFANFTRIYPDQYSSMPTVFDPAELGYEEGQEVNAKELANAFYEQLPYKKVARGGSEFYGLEEALSDYKRNWFIAKERVDDARANISHEIDEVFEKVKAAKGSLLFDSDLQEQLLGQKNNDGFIPF